MSTIADKELIKHILDETKFIINQKYGYLIYLKIWPL